MSSKGGKTASRHVNYVDLGGNRRSVTATYRYGDALLSLVAQTKHDCDRDARKRWGEWDGEPCYSTPRSIWLDLTGRTLRKTTQRGMYKAGRAHC